MRSGASPLVLTVPITQVLVLQPHLELAHIDHYRATQLEVAADGFGGQRAADQTGMLPANAQQLKTEARCKTSKTAAAGTGVTRCIRGTLSAVRAVDSDEPPCTAPEATASETCRECRRAQRRIPQAGPVPVPQARRGVGERAPLWPWPWLWQAPWPLAEAPPLRSRQGCRDLPLKSSRLLF